MKIHAICLALSSQFLLHTARYNVHIRPALLANWAGSGEVKTENIYLVSDEICIDTAAIPTLFS